jgi:hypothetical protein
MVTMANPGGVEHELLRSRRLSIPHFSPGAAENGELEMDQECSIACDGILCRGRHRVFHVIAANVRRSQH